MDIIKVSLNNLEGLLTVDVDECFSYFRNSVLDLIVACLFNVTVLLPVLARTLFKQRFLISMYFTPY